jgi:hypothetical protein
MNDAMSGKHKCGSKLRLFAGVYIQETIYTGCLPTCLPDNCPRSPKTRRTTVLSVLLTQRVGMSQLLNTLSNRLRTLSKGKQARGDESEHGRAQQMIPTQT